MNGNGPADFYEAIIIQWLRRGLRVKNPAREYGACWLFHVNLYERIRQPEVGYPQEVSGVALSTSKEKGCSVYPVR
jgi:hypothetical protein